MNPYGYVGNNPETETDPTGQMYACPGGCGGGSDGSNGNNNSTSQNTTPSGSGSQCAWYDPLCNLQHAWNNTVHAVQTAWNDTVHAYEQAWNYDVNVVSQGGQLLEQTGAGLFHFLASHIAIGIAVVATVAIGIAIWAIVRHFKGSPGWTRPTWADLQAIEGITRQRYINGRLVDSTPRTIGEHVQVDPGYVENRARQRRRDSSAFYNDVVAQWAVDYALMNMTDAHYSNWRLWRRIHAVDYRRWFFLKQRLTMSGMSITMNQIQSRGSKQKAFGLSLPWIHKEIPLLLPHFRN